jgi:hypothetical protein
MGRNYELNRDGYVYVYSENRHVSPKAELILFRVPKSQILKRSEYEYFAGLRSNGDALWDKHIEARAVVQTAAIGWIPSVAYNAPLGLYMMVNGGGSHLELYTAPQPWGPWTLNYQNPRWVPADDPGIACYQPQIAPKWIAPDGKSFWLVWSGIRAQQTKVELRIVRELKHARTHEEAVRLGLQWQHGEPYYAFNTQRVDLVTA